MKETGLSNAAFDSDFKDIEHLVERKKVVAWADQTNEHSNRNDLPGISLLMTFPQLEPIQSISCCTSVSDPNVLKLTPQRRTRRKIIPSPLKVQHTQKSALSESTQLNDSFSKELQPIVYTPEDCKKAQDLFPSLTRTSLQSANVMNDNSLKALCRIESPLSRTECKQGLYSTSTLCDSIRGLKNKWPEQEPLASSKSSVHRIESSSFSTKDSMPESAGVPSYMAMTTAAKRKWKQMSSTSNASIKSDESCGFAKRIRRDNSSVKPMQENRLKVGYKRNTNKTNSNMLTIRRINVLVWYLCLYNRVFFPFLKYLVCLKISKSP